MKRLLCHCLAGWRSLGDLQLESLFLGAVIVATVLLPTRAQALDLPRIDIQRDGKGIQLAWTGGLLQTATAVSGPWLPVAGASSPHKVATPQGTALFRVQQADTVTVLKSGTGSGTVRSTPDGIACGTDCAEVWPAGQTLTLQAMPDDGSTFAGWTGDCTGTGACQVMVDGPKSVTATFARTTAATVVMNGDFEQGPTVGWQQEPGQLIFTGAELGVSPHSGQYLARLGFDPDNRKLARIGQQITLPGSTPLFLNFALWLYSEERCDVPCYDKISLYVAGQTVVEDDRVCQSSDTGGWRRYSVDVTAGAGLTVAVVFEISSFVDGLTSVMLLDDIAISDKPWQ
jgi:hypothetical protein